MPFPNANYHKKLSLAINIVVESIIVKSHNYKFHFRFVSKFQCGMQTEHLILSFYPFVQMILSGFVVNESQMLCCLIKDVSALVFIQISKF